MRAHARLQASALQAGQSPQLLRRLPIQRSAGQLPCPETPGTPQCVLEPSSLQDTPAGCNVQWGCCLDPWCPLISLLGPGEAVHMRSHNPEGIGLCAPFCAAWGCMRSCSLADTDPFHASTGVCRSLSSPALVSKPDAHAAAPSLRLAQLDWSGSRVTGQAQCLWGRLP